MEHNAVLKSLLDLGVEPTYIRIIQEINKDTTTQITLFNDPITINIGKGVRQGDVISPILFTSALENMLRKTNLNGGINIDGEILNTLLFADDIVLIAETASELEKLLHQINKVAEDIGLSIHPEKTKWM